MARDVMEQIVDHGKVIRGHLGVAIQSVNPDLAKAFGLSQGGGALVADVTPESPAAKAGIERGDIILALNGQPVNEPDDLSVRIAETAPGTTVHLKISRSGQLRDLAVTLGQELEKTETYATGEPGGAVMRGIQVQNLTPTVLDDLGISRGVHGVVITSVDDSSAAGAAGLQSGDVIEEVNQKPVSNVEQFNRALAEVHSTSVLLLVNRGGSTRYVVIESR